MKVPGIMLSFDWKTKKTTVVPTISFSLAAIVRTQDPGGTAVSAFLASQEVPQYALVHERKNRGWWLPGGGIESYDDTPVDAAVRETMEEASSASEFDRGGANFSPPLPTMTHHSPPLAGANTGTDAIHLSGGMD